MKRENSWFNRREPKRGWNLRIRSSDYKIKLNLKDREIHGVNFNFILFNCLICIHILLIIGHIDFLPDLLYGLTFCMLSNFFMLFCPLLIFFMNNDFEKFFQETNHCQTAW